MNKITEPLMPQYEGGGQREPNCCCCISGTCGLKWLTFFAVSASIGNIGAALNFIVNSHDAVSVTNGKPVWGSTNGLIGGALMIIPAALAILAARSFVSWCKNDNKDTRSALPKA